jgi:H+/Cl- antiporter ClcA
MKVQSQAGKFVLSFERMEPGEGELVITGKMGVWEATTHMSLAELVAILGMTLKPRVLWFLLKALLSGRFFRRATTEE